MATSLVAAGNGALGGGGVAVREFRRGSREDATAFRELNEAWIAKYFGMEEADHATLDDPEGHVIEPGGRIFLAVLGEETVGCCGLVALGGGVYDVVKMGVKEEIRGKGIGRALLAHAIAEARAMGAVKLTLETNSRLANAIHLYEAMGFRHIPPAASEYARADTFMEMAL